MRLALALCSPVHGLCVSSFKPLRPATDTPSSAYLIACALACHPMHRFLCIGFQAPALSVSAWLCVRLLPLPALLLLLCLCACLRVCVRARVCLAVSGLWLGDAWAAPSRLDAVLPGPAPSSARRPVVWHLRPLSPCHSRLVSLCVLRSPASPTARVPCRLAQRWFAAPRPSGRLAFLLSLALSRGFELGVM